MHVLATAAVRTEAGQVVGAQNTTHMPMATMGTVATETTIVPGTIFDLALRIYVQEGTLLIVARMKTRVEVALWHLGHVKLVQELALVALFAQTSQPMFAHDSPIATNVSEWTAGALVTVHAVDTIVELTHGGCGFWK